MLATATHPGPPARPVDYPDDDGNPLSDNTLQFQWIMTIQGGLDAMFADREDVFVAGDLLWYPAEGDNDTRVAPDAMVVFGRPKGPRSSYRQWEEDGIAPQVVFEVLSPGNRAGEMIRKRQFYARFGVQEYYLYDPGDPHDGEDRTTDLQGWRRTRVGSGLMPIQRMEGWRSPRLGITFEFSNAGELRIIRPDCRPFETFVEASLRADAAQLRAEQETRRAEQESLRAEQESLRAEQERLRAEQETRRAEQESLRAERLAERLRAAGIDPDAV